MHTCAKPNTVTTTTAPFVNMLKYLATFPKLFDCMYYRNTCNMLLKFAKHKQQDAQLHKHMQTHTTPQHNTTQPIKHNSKQTLVCLCNEHVRTCWQHLNNTDKSLQQLRIVSVSCCLCYLCFMPFWRRFATGVGFWWFLEHNMTGFGAFWICLDFGHPPEPGSPTSRVSVGVVV